MEPAGLAPTFIPPGYHGRSGTPWGVMVDTGLAGWRAKAPQVSGSDAQEIFRFDDWGLPAPAGRAESAPRGASRDGPAGADPL